MPTDNHPAAVFGGQNAVEGGRCYHSRTSDPAQTPINIFAAPRPTLRSAS